MRRDWPSILKDAKERGLGIRPLAHGKAAGRALAKNNAKVRHKLSPENVIELRARLKAGETRQAIAKDYGISMAHVSSVANGRRRAQG